MNCNICASVTSVIFEQSVLNKHNVKYYKCSSCKVVFTEKPHWLDEAYSESINIIDSGLLSRSFKHSRILSVLIYFYFDRNKRFIDYAGGYGVLVRLMRDLGFDYYWDDLYTKNIHAIGFDHGKSGKYELLSTIECFEHLEDPMAEIEKMTNLSDSIYFSTELLTKHRLDPESWDYYGFSHGQHITFYSIHTLKYIANKFNYNLYSDGKKWHLLTKNRYIFNPVKMAKFLEKIGFPGFIKFPMKKQRKILEKKDGLVLNSISESARQDGRDLD